MHSNVCNLEIISETMCELSKSYPPFHSEADFKYHFACKLRDKINSNNIFLEYPVPPFHIDLWLKLNEDIIAIEFKYKTEELQFTDKERGINYNLKNHDAPNFGRYDFVYDIYRLEQILKKNKISNNSKGYAIF